MDRKTWIILGGTALASFSAGALGGIWYCKRTLVAGYEAILAAEIEEMRVHYLQQSRPRYATPQEAARDLLPDAEVIFNELSNELKITSPEEEAELLEQNIFDGDLVEPDEDTLQRDEAARTPHRPYIISDEEYMQNEPEHKQVTVTFYEGDHVLADERDEPIENIEEYVGKENVVRFGYRSKDRNIVYVRNEEIEVDFEVARSTGFFSVEVLGYDAAPVKRVIKPARR